MQNSRPTGASAVDRAKAVLRERVAQGEYVPGQRLVEPEIAVQLGVSRATLREAFRGLEAEGLLRLERYKGASVRRLAHAEVAELFEIREMLEGLAARRAAGAAAGERARVGVLVRQMEDAAAAGQVERYSALNLEFHDLLLALAHSGTLAGLAAQIRMPVVLRLLHRRLLSADAIGKSLAEHRGIAQAVVAGEAERAEQAMRRHIRSSLRSVERMPGLG